MTGLTRLLVIAAVTALGLAAVPAVPQPAPLELIDVGVEGADGQAVTGLTRDDFQVTTGGAARPIESFAVGPEQPLSLVLLFDVTSSMDNMIKRSVLRSGVEKWFVDRLAPQDRVHVGSFGKQMSIGAPIAGNPRALMMAVRKALDPRDADTFGPSPIWDAVDLAVETLANASGRRAIILVTDGRATGNRQSRESVAMRAVAARVAVSVVGEDWEMTLRQDGSTGVRRTPRRFARVDCHGDRRALYPRPHQSSGAGPGARAAACRSPWPLHPRLRTARARRQAARARHPCQPSGAEAQGPELVHRAGRGDFTLVVAYSPFAIPSSLQHSAFSIRAFAPCYLTGVGAVSVRLCFVSALLSVAARTKSAFASAIALGSCVFDSV